MDHIERTKADENSRTLLRRDDALRLLGRMPFQYRDLQVLYSSQVHMPDYRTFSANWDKTLYDPIRSEINELIRSMASASQSSLLYCAPGPHAPLLRDSKILSTLQKLTLLDIYGISLCEAKLYLKSVFKFVQIDATQIDFTGPFGQRLCDVYTEALKGAEEIGQVVAKLRKYESLSRRIFFDHPQVVVALSNAINPSSDRLHPIIVSEMVASFTGTAVLLGSVHAI